jgi:TolA binding protein trimerisation
MARGLRDRRGYLRVGGTGRLYQQLGRLERENAALRGQVDRLQHANQQLQGRVRKLTGQVEELRRAAKRQAAPFSKNTPTPRPRRPGRKRGAAYGRVACRPAPSGSTGWSVWGCRRSARTAATSWRWNGWPASTRKTCRRRARRW